jgi:hypothetical protein
MAERASAAAGAVKRTSVSIELSQVQIERVLRDAGAAHSILQVILAGMSRVALASEQLDDRRLSRSLLLGLSLLAAMPTDGSYASLTALSRALGMSMSMAHRYASTLTATGLLERDAITRRYRLAYAP